MVLYLLLLITLKHFKKMKKISMYLLAMTLGVLLVLACIWLCGFEETMIYGLAFVIGKLILQDITTRE